MENIFIIWGAIVVVFLITGIVLVRNDKKRKKNDVLTDDVKILFEDNLKNFYSNSLITDNDIFSDTDTIYNEDSSLQDDINVDKNKDIVDNLFDEEII